MRTHHAITWSCGVILFLIACNPDRINYKKYPFAGTYRGNTIERVTESYWKYADNQGNTWDSTYTIQTVVEYPDSILIKPVEPKEQNTYTIDWPIMNNRWGGNLWRTVGGAGIHSCAERKHG